MEINTKNNSEDFIYLFELQRSGRTNMFGAGAFLEAERGVESKKARQIAFYWMVNYTAIAKELEVDV